MERATFGTRFLAALCDFGIMLPVAVVLLWLFGGSTFYVFVSTGITAAYAYLEVARGQTLGKQFMGIAIRAQDGNPAPQEFLLKRYAIKMAPSVLSLLGVLLGVGLLANLSMLAGLVFFVGCFLVLGQDRLALHDRIAETAVYKIS